MTNTATETPTKLARKSLKSADLEFVTNACKTSITIP